MRFFPTFHSAGEPLGAIASGRLVESMGRGERVTPAALDDLALEWIAVGPIEPPVHDVLLVRFERCRNADDSMPQVGVQRSGLST